LNARGARQRASSMAAGDSRVCAFCSPLLPPLTTAPHAPSARTWPTGKRQLDHGRRASARRTASAYICRHGAADAYESRHSRGVRTRNTAPLLQCLVGMGYLFYARPRISLRALLLRFFGTCTAGSFPAPRLAAPPPHYGVCRRRLPRLAFSYCSCWRRQTSRRTDICY